MSSKRILLTGLSTYWGGRLAQALERDPAVEAIIGVDRRPPKVELHRTEFVRVTDSHSLIRRVVEAAEIDTVIDTRLVVDSIVTSPRLAHENNVMGTMNVLAACGGEGSPVRKVVFKSSAHYYGAERDDPAFFTEAMDRPHAPRTPIECDIVDAERAVREFALRHPHVTVTVLRFANGLGQALRTSLSQIFGLLAVPGILGFDPRFQFIHEDDLAGCLEHAVRHDLEGVYNGAADGVLVLSEVARLLGKQLAPVLPPLGTSLAAGALRRAGVRISPETLGLLRYGRGLDNRKLKATGYRYRYTSREAVVKLREDRRLAAFAGDSQEAYRYERDLEEFLRRSPSVRPTARRPDPAPRNLVPGERRGANPVHGTGGYDDLNAGELIALLPSLEPAALAELAAHEGAHAARPEVMQAIASLQGWEAGT
ncbi:MAG: NAD-dependent epimerase/dehydratase family protein [Solirubrobacteraceae bacterium]